ncbi:MAG: argininosuccinate lyase [Endomicrobiia bacterium]
MQKELLDRFLSSFNLDRKLIKYDIEACIAWITTLFENKIIDKKQSSRLIKVLKNLKKQKDLKNIQAEDVHYAVEKKLERVLKKDKYLAGVIRTARSRNDLVVSDERMYIKDEINQIIVLLKNLISSIVEVAQKNLDVPMVGYTHLQPAQPVLFSHYILSFAWWFVRDIERFKDCYKRVDVSTLGAAAFAGSSFEVNRQKVAEKLGFLKVSENSVDSVSDRDYIIEFISCCAIVMIHLSRIAEELIIWCTPNFGYISLPKKLTSGSSIMPQKQNPDYLELIRGKTAKVISDLIGILVVMKALPLTYNRDMQEDKVYLFSSVETIKDCLRVMRVIFENLMVNAQRLKEDIQKHDFIFATEVANFLVEEMKYPFKLAHKKTQLLIDYCVKTNKKLKQLGLKDYKKIVSREFTIEMFEKLNRKFNNSYSNYKTFGGSSLPQVKRQIKNIKKLIV